MNDPLLETGLSLHVIAKKGLSFFRKALSCAAQKWDMKNEPTKSGTSAYDFIEFFFNKIHKDMNYIEVNYSEEEEEDLN